MRMDTNNTAQLAQANAHRTAIRRARGTGMSTPVKFLLESKRLMHSNGCGLMLDVLDFGCGRGMDADLAGFEKYDPHFFSEMPEGQFDVVVCNYVLNVLPIEKQDELVAKILSKVKAGGKAYITVRRDVKKEGFTSKGTYQRNVTLNYPVLSEKKGQYCIYEIAN